MRIEHLNYLVEVAKHKSISTAAKKLYISQTGLSAIINSIEAELNIKLFYRTNKGVSLTVEGEQAILIMKDILTKNDELHFLSSDEGQQRRIINLGVFPAATNALSRYLTGIWSKQHSQTHLHVYEVGYEDLQNCIASHLASIIIAAESSNYLSATTLQNGKVYVEPLCNDHFCVLVSSQSELAAKNAVDISEIMDMHLLLTHNYPSPQDKPIGHILHSFSTFTVLNNLEVTKQILADSPDKVIITPTLTLEQDPLIRNGKLKMLDVTGFENTLTIFMMCDVTSRLSIQETLLMQEIRNFFASLKQ